MDTGIIGGVLTMPDFQKYGCLVREIVWGSPKLITEIGNLG